MKSTDIKGIIPPVVTPMNPEDESVNIPPKHRELYLRELLFQQLYPGLIPDIGQCPYRKFQQPKGIPKLPVYLPPSSPVMGRHRFWAGVIVQVADGSSQA